MKKKILYVSVIFFSLVIFWATGCENESPTQAVKDVALEVTPTSTKLAEIGRSCETIKIVKDSGTWECSAKTYPDIGDKTITGEGQTADSSITECLKNLRAYVKAQKDKEKKQEDKNTKAGDSSVGGINLDSFGGKK